MESSSFFLIVLNCYITLYIYIYKKSCLNLNFLLTFNLNSLIWCLELFTPYNTYNVLDSPPKYNVLIRNDLSN